jgi:Zn-dependent protease
MLRSWKIGSAFGIPLYINPTFLLLPMVVLLGPHGAGGWPTSLFWMMLTLVLFGCIVLHELGHALMARYFGVRTRDITLYPIGGVARLERMPQRPTEELLVALAGPAVNVVIVCLLAPLVVLAALAGVLHGDIIHALFNITPHMGLWTILGLFLAGLTFLNIGLVIFNLLPAFPMDGGRVLRALLAMGWGQLRATEIAATIGLVLAVLLGGLALLSHNGMLLILCIFLGFAGQQELYALRHQEALRQQHALRQQLGFANVLEPVMEPVSPVLIQQPRLPEPDLNNPFPAVAFLGGRQVPREPGFTGFLWDHDYQIWVCWRDGQPVAAYWARAQ